MRLRTGLAAALLLASIPAMAGAASAGAGSEFAARVLSAHNNERARAGLALLAWDDRLAIGAADYARQMAATARFGHSNRRARRGIGENLWMGTRGMFPVESMVGAWASEKRWFVGGVFPNVSRTGNWVDVAHYTQMIWPTTRRIGCATASAGRLEYLVCRYGSAGNIEGHSLR